MLSLLVLFLFLLLLLLFLLLFLLSLYQAHTSQHDVIDLFAWVVLVYHTVVISVADDSVAVATAEPTNQLRLAGCDTEGNAYLATNVVSSSSCRCLLLLLMFAAVAVVLLLFVLVACLLVCLRVAICVVFLR